MHHQSCWKILLVVKQTAQGKNAHVDNMVLFVPKYAEVAEEFVSWIVSQ